MEHDDMISRQSVTWDGSIVRRSFYCSKKCFDSERDPEVLIYDE